MAVQNRPTPDEMQQPTRRNAASKASVNAVLSRVTSYGNSLLSLLSGLLAAVLILFSGYVLYDTFYTQNAAASTAYDLLQYRPEIIDDGATPLAGADTLAKINQDYRAWLTMYDTSIDYPVMQGENDLYYASHDIYGNSSLTGALYLAAGNRGDISDSYNLIYGHHMDNGAMFGALDLFRDDSYTESHREGVLVSATGVFDLTVFAVVDTDAYESGIYSVGDRMDEVLDFIRARYTAPDEKSTTLFLDESVLPGVEKIAALSTCASAETNGRLVVFAVMTRRPLITVEAAGYEGMYDARPHGITTEVNYPADATIEYSTDGGATWTTDMPTRTDVGTTTVLVKASSEYYGEATTSAAITVTHAPVTVTAADAGKVYGSGDPAFTAVVSGVLDNTAIQYTVTRTGADENAGTYEDVLIPSGAATQGNYIVTYVPADFTITPASALTVTPAGYSGVYDANAHTADAAVNITEGTTIEFSTDGVNWSPEAPGIRDVGSETVYVRAVNPNYVTAEATTTLSVTPAPVTVTAIGANKIYGDADPAFTATVSGVLDDYAVTYTVNRIGGGEDTGTHTGVIVPTGDALQGNYAVTYLPADLVITASDALALTATGYSGVYDASAHTGSAYVNITAGTTVEYSADGGATWTTAMPGITNVGSVSVLVRATNPNYAPVTRTVTLTVTPATVRVTANSANKTFGDPDPAFTASVSGVIDGYAIVYTVERVGEDENAGTYPGVIVPTGAASQGNYNVVYVSGDLTIVPDGTLTVTAEGFDGVYDAAEHTVAAAANIPDGTTIEYSVDGGETWTSDPPSITDVGEISVLVRAVNPNYEPAEAEALLRVTPRAVTVVANGASKLAGTDDPVFTAVVDGVIDGYVIVYTVSRPGAGTDEAVGTYMDAIVPAGADVQGNYVVTYIPANFVIINNPDGVPAGTDNPGRPSDPQNPSNPEEPGDPEDPGADTTTLLEELFENDTPLARFVQRFQPKPGRSTPAWALVNLLALIVTAYILLPLLHLRAKYRRSKWMKKINQAKEELREAQELQELERLEKLLIDRQAAMDRAKAAGEDVEAAVRAAEAEAFAEITEDDFSAAVETLYFRVKKFLRRFRIGIVLEFVDVVVAIIAFILTEDMRNPMILIDMWTPLMLLLLLICWIVDVRLARYRAKVLADEEIEEEIEKIEAETENITAES